MKILFLCGADHKYGTLKMAINIIEFMNKYNKFEFIVLTQKQGEINQFCNEKGVENYVVPYRYCVYAPHTKKLLNLLKKYLKVCIVSFYNKRALGKLKKLVNLDTVNIIHTNINRDLFGMMVSKKYKIPNITHLREYSKDHFQLEFLYPNQINFMNTYSEKFIAISKAVEKDWIQRGLDRKKIEMIYDGVDEQGITFQEKSLCDKVKIVMCGGIYEGKGQLQLVKALKLLKDRRILNIDVDIYGDNEGKVNYRAVVEEYIHDNNLHEIAHLRGYKADVSKILYQYDIGVVCSKSEGFGLVTVEYMLAGLCPVVSNTGANKELVINNHTGVLYKYGDIDSLADALENVIINKSFREECGKSALNRAGKEFTMARCAQEISNIYMEIAGEKNDCV